MKRTFDPNTTPRLATSLIATFVLCAGVFVAPGAGAGVSVHFTIGHGYYTGHHYYPRYGFGHHRYHAYGHYGHPYHLGYLFPFTSHDPWHGHTFAYSPSHLHRGHYEAVGRDTYVYDRLSDRRITPSARSAPATAVSHDGWALLASGRAADALQRFGSTTDRAPEDGVPQTGYSIAASVSGDLERGVLAMRQALRTDPQALHRLKIPAGARAAVVESINRYEAGGVGSVSDDAFMRAALYYLLHHRDSARAAIDEAQAAGDRSASAANLERLIGVVSG